MKTIRILALHVLFLTILAPLSADDGTSVEAWLGKGGKLVRSPSGQVESVTFYGEKSVAAQRDKTVEGRRFTDADLARLAGLSELTKIDLDGFMDITGTASRSSRG